MHRQAVGGARGARSGRHAWAGALALAALLSAAACTDSGGETRKPRTEHERDSIIAQSSLPGAAAVSRAMRAQDQGNDRNARLDSIAASIP